MSSYQPINCGLYDYIEHYATLGTIIPISYLDEGGETREVIDRILDTKLQQGEEFLILDGGLMLRLDRILQLAEVDFKAGGACSMP